MKLRGIINRRAMIAFDEFLIVILVVLVIAAVLMFLFKVDILTYVRNLPGYGVPEDEEVDLSNLTKDQFSALCPVRVAKVVFSGTKGFRKEYIYSPNGIERIKYNSDDIYLDGDIIKVNDANFLKDTDIGIVDSNNKISIYSPYFVQELKKLNNAWFITKKRRLICSSQEILQEQTLITNWRLYK